MSDCAPVSTDPASAVMLSELLAGITELPESDDCLVHGVIFWMQRLIKKWLPCWLRVLMKGVGQKKNKHSPKLR